MRLPIFVSSLLSMTAY